MKRSDVEIRPVVGYEGLYEISTDGQVRSLDRTVRCSRNPSIFRVWRGRLLKPKPVNKAGHLEVHLSRDGIVSRRLVHHLVLEAFVGPRPAGMQGLHWDDVPANNHVTNLRWGTPSQNGLDSVRNGTNYFANKTECPQGHEYTPANTYISPRGARVCRQCRNDKGRDVYHTRKMAAAL